MNIIINRSACLIEGCASPLYLINMSVVCNNVEFLLTKEILNISLLMLSWYQIKYFQKKYIKTYNFKTKQLYFVFIIELQLQNMAVSGGIKPNVFMKKYFE